MSLRSGAVYNRTRNESSPLTVSQYIKDIRQTSDVSEQSTLADSANPEQIIFHEIRESQPKDDPEAERTQVIINTDVKVDNRKSVSVDGDVDNTFVEVTDTPVSHVTSEADKIHLGKGGYISSPVKISQAVKNTRKCIEEQQAGHIPLLCAVCDTNLTTEPTSIRCDSEDCKYLFHPSCLGDTGPIDNEKWFCHLCLQKQALLEDSKLKMIHAYAN